MFELIDRDAGARIGKWTVNNRTITTPNIAIVINPNKMIVKPDELKKEFGCDIIITNSWIINRSEKVREEALKQGLHKYFKFDGIILNDSGVFQSYSQGIDVATLNQNEIIDFQHKIGADIITPIDHFTLPTDTEKEVKKKIDTTTKNVLLARKEIKDRFLIAPIQGGVYPQMRAYAAKKLANSGADIFAIGGIVPLMEQYRFKELCDAILSAKMNIPAGTPVHAFGAGHPMVFALLAAIGCDLFDSAMYAISADRGSYLTSRGTFKLENLKEFPCNCKVCFVTTPQEVSSRDELARKEFLIRHNLYVTFAEMRTVRQAIREDGLWELVQERVRAHPALLEAYEFVLEKYGPYLESVDQISKQNAFFYAGAESLKRPELTRALKMAGKSIPSELSGVYPFGQNVGLKIEFKGSKPKPKDIVAKTVDFQFGKGTSKLIGKFEVESSKTTGRLRRVMKGKDQIGTIRSYDGFFIPTAIGAQLIFKNMKKVIVKEKEVIKLVKEGKNVFAKFVYKADTTIVPGESVAVTDGKNLLAHGTAILNGREMLQIKRGMAVETRSRIEI